MYSVLFIYKYLTRFSNGTAKTSLVHNYFTYQNLVICVYFQLQQYGFHTHFNHVLNSEEPAEYKVHWIIILEVVQGINYPYILFIIHQIAILVLTCETVLLISKNKIKCTGLLLFQFDVPDVLLTLRLCSY